MRNAKLIFACIFPKFYVVPQADSSWCAGRSPAGIHCWARAPCAVAEGTLGSGGLVWDGRGGVVDGGSWGMGQVCGRLRYPVPSCAIPSAGPTPAEVGQGWELDGLCRCRPGGQSVGAACSPPFWPCCEPLCLQKRERRAASEGSSDIFTSVPLPAETSSDPVCGFIGGRGRKTTLKSSLGEHVRRGKTFPYLLSVDY